MARVEIVIGSKSDAELVAGSKMFSVFDSCEVFWRLSIISAHRHPDSLKEFIGQTLMFTDIYIAAAGMSAALPGAIAALTLKPVIGVALPSEEFPNCLDSLLAITRMPPGVPVAFAGMGNAGLRNAAILACQILGLTNSRIVERLRQYQSDNAKLSEIGFKQSKGGDR